MTHKFVIAALQTWGYCSFKNLVHKYPNHDSGRYEVYKAASSLVRVLGVAELVRQGTQ